jgi:hypothetical protein
MLDMPGLDLTLNIQVLRAPHLHMLDKVVDQIAEGLTA